MRLTSDEMGDAVAHATGQLLRVMEGENMLLRSLQAHRLLAETKRLAIISVYRELNFSEKAQEAKAQHWTDFVDRDYYELRTRANQEGLNWCETTVPVIDSAINIDRRTSLRRAIRGALNDTIGTHGPINKTNFTSAAKRIEGAILTYNHLIETKKTG